MQMHIKNDIRLLNTLHKINMGLMWHHPLWHILDDPHTVPMTREPP